MNYGALAGWSWRGHGCAREYVCTQWLEMALAYVLTVWSTMAGVAESGGEQRKNRGLTVGVGVEWIAVQWWVVAM